MQVQSKKIGLFSAVIIQTNAMIGAGVVAIPAILAQTTGAVGLLAYVLCIIIILCMTFSLGELSLLHGGSAWCYRFPSIWGKHKAGMIASSCYVFGVLVAMGFVAKQAGIWLHEIIQFISADMLCLLIIGILSGLVWAGKNVSSFWQFVYSGMIFLGIITVSMICFINSDPELFFQENQGNAFSILMVAPVLLFSFLGFESIVSLYAIVKNPKKNVFIGGLIGVVSVGILYIAFSSSVIAAINPNFFLESGNNSLAAVLSQAFPQYKIVSKFIYLGGLFAIIGTLHSMIWSVSVLFVDILQKSKSNRVLRIAQNKKSSMNFAILFSAFLIMTSGFLLRSESILNISVFLIALSYVLSISALFNEKSHRMKNRIICSIGVFGGCLMGVFSLYSLLISFI